MTEFATIILAGGKGQRMQSTRPKVLHEIAGQPMMGYVLAAAQAAGAQLVITVTPPEPLTTRHYIDAFMQSSDCTHTHATQNAPLGTGDAVRCALSRIADIGRVVIICGDTPLMRPETLARLANDEAALTILGFEPADAAAYGRIILKDNKPHKIIEFKDADTATRKISLCNSGAMAIDSALLHKLLPKLQNDNAQQEFYLTDLLALAVADGQATNLVMGTADEVLGVDSRQGLARAEKLMQSRLRHKLLAAGVTMQDPDSVYVSFDTAIAPDVVLEPHIYCGTGVSIGTNCTIRAFSHLEGVRIGENVSIGPFARLRLGTQIADHARIGNFVETKQAKIGAGSKVNHLSYIGDATLGRDVNIGAGTITCNYDGFNKHQTTIGDGAFIGSNSSLIAPIVIGQGAYIGSGTAISDDVQADALAITRADKREIDGWAIKFRQQQKPETDK